VPQVVSSLSFYAPLIQWLGVTSAVTAHFRSQLEYVDVSAMMHQMNRPGRERCCNGPRRGHLRLTPLPRRGTEACGQARSRWAWNKAAVTDQSVPRFPNQYPITVPAIPVIGAMSAEKSVGDMCASIATSGAMISAGPPQTRGNPSPTIRTKSNTTESNMRLYRYVTTAYFGIPLGTTTSAFLLPQYYSSSIAV
jgi:hypothetical protein